MYEINMPFELMFSTSLKKTRPYSNITKLSEFFSVRKNPIQKDGDQKIVLELR